MQLKTIAKAGLQSGSIMFLADTFTQTVVEGSSSLDGNRAVRWGLAGLCLHGPYFWNAFRLIDARLGPAATNLSTVLKKTAVAQFVVFPPYLVALFGYLGVMENHPDVLTKIQTKVPEAFLAGCVFWPVANCVNFAVVPSTVRVPYLAVVGGCWNSFLSWDNNAQNRKTSKMEK